MIQTKKTAVVAGERDGRKPLERFARPMIPHFTRLAQPGEPSRPAELTDIIVDRGEFIGYGIPRTAGGRPFEPLSWAWLWRQNREHEEVIA